MQKYKISIATYQQGEYINSDCSDITFINQGATPCQINNQITLQAGQSLSITAQANELDTTNYKISFPSGTIANNSLVVIRKIYS